MARHLEHAAQLGDRMAVFVDPQVDPRIGNSFQNTGALLARATVSRRLRTPSFATTSAAVVNVMVANAITPILYQLFEDDGQYDR